jgi:flagellar basal-body rod modification protein FlgD
MAVSDFAASLANQATSAATTASDQTSAQLVKKNLGKEDFLKLLVTQLRYQDPMSPDDPKEFVAQLAQFSSLEQQITANQNLENVGQLVSSLKISLGMSQGVNLLGKTVKGLGNSLSLAGGQTTSASYQLPRDAKEVQVSIFDGAGRLVRTLNLGSQTSGLRQFSWDGKNAEGKLSADGAYTYQVTALDSQGKGIEVTNYFTGKVQEVFQDSRGVWLKVDGRVLPLDSIVSVLQAS